MQADAALARAVAGLGGAVVLGAVSDWSPKALKAALSDLAEALPRPERSGLGRHHRHADDASGGSVEGRKDAWRV